MPNFHQTRYGQNFFSRQLPQLIKSINRVADNLDCDKELKIPNSSLVATVNQESTYPSIIIELVTKLSRSTVAVVEYNNGEGIRTIAYNDKDEDYDTITNWEKK